MRWAERRILPVDQREMDRVFVVGPCGGSNAHEPALVEVSARDVHGQISPAQAGAQHLALGRQDASGLFTRAAFDAVRPAEDLAVRRGRRAAGLERERPGFVARCAEADARDERLHGIRGGRISGHQEADASRAALADTGKAAAIHDYLSLLAQAHRWANSHLSAWAAVWAKASGLPLTVMNQAASDDYSTAVPITPAVVASEQQVADAFTKAGLIPVHVDFSQFVDTSFNTTVGAS